MPATPETISIFNDALSNFKKSLTPEQCAAFKDMSAAKFEAEAKKIEQKHHASRKARNMARVSPFIKSILSLTNVLNIFTQASDLMVVIWGPACFLLEVASKWFDALDKLLDALESLGESLSIFEKYSDLLKHKMTNQKDPQHFDLAMMLGRVYTDILDILLLSMKIFPRNAIKQIGIAIWPPFDRKLKTVLEKFEKDRTVLESALLAENFAQARRWQTEIEQRFIEQERRSRITVVEAIRQALQPAAPSTKVQDAIDILQQRNNAGDWLLKTDELKQWMKLNAGSRAAVLTGNPGAGKSILSAIVAQTVKNNFSSILNCQILMAFLSYQEGQNSTCLSILSTLLYQTLLTDWHMYDIIMEKYGPDLHAFSKSKRQLRDALVDTVAYGPAFFIIDGFDEISRDERQELMEILRHIYNSSPQGTIKFFLSSRPELDFLRETSRMNPPPSLVKVTTESTNEDMESFLISDQNINILKDIHQYEHEKAKSLLLAVGKKSCGMFLYAKLVLAEFKVQTCPREVEDAIENLPRGLEEAYDRVFQRMNISGPRKKRSIRLLELLLKAKRQLRAAEIVQAIMMDDIFDEYGKCNALTIPIEELGGGLVEIREQNVSFVHFSVYEYLLKEDQVFKMQEFDIHVSIAMLCIRYLCMGSVKLELTSDQLQDFILDGEYAFLPYAYENWLHHVKISQSNGRPLPGKLRTVLKLFCELHFQQFLQSSDTPDPVQSCLLAVERTIQERTKAQGTDVKDPSDLGALMSKINFILKLFGLRAPQDIKGQLEIWYGGIYRCSNTSCGYFTVGFNKKEDLNDHEKKHLRRFLCHHAGCPRNLRGFSTDAELALHKKSHDDTTAMNFDISSLIPGHVSINKDIINPKLISKIFMDAIAQQDHNVIVTIKNLKAAKFDFKELSWVPQLVLYPETLRKWVDMTDLEPLFLLEAAVQCEDESISQAFLDAWEFDDQTYRRSFSSQKRYQEDVYIHLLCFAASKGLVANVRTLLKANILRLAEKLELELRVDLWHPRNYTPVLSPLLFAIYSGDQSTIDELLPSFMACEPRVAVNMLYAALGVGHEFAVKTILGFPQIQRYLSEDKDNLCSVYHVVTYSKARPEMVPVIVTLLTEAGFTPQRYLRWGRIMRYSNHIENLEVLDTLLKLHPPKMLDAEFIACVVAIKNKKRAIVALHLLEAGWDPILPAEILRRSRRKSPRMNEFETFVGKTWEQAVEQTQPAREKRREELEMAKGLDENQNKSS